MLSRRSVFQKIAVGLGLAAIGLPVRSEELPPLATEDSRPVFETSQHWPGGLTTVVSKDGEIVWWGSTKNYEEYYLASKPWLRGN